MSVGVESKDFTFSLVKDVEEWNALEPEVEKLYSSLANPNPYFSPEWLSCWRKWFAPESKPRIAIVRGRRGELESCWPFVERGGILGARILWPFVYDEANYFDPLGDFSKPDLGEFLCRNLQALLGEFHFIWLPLLRKSFWDDHLEPVVESTRDPVISRIPRETCFAELSKFSSFDDYVSSNLGSKSRKTLRYNRRRLEGLGSLKFESFADSGAMSSFLPTSCIVEVNSWKSKQVAGLYSIRGKRAFFFELLPLLAEKGRATASCMRVDDVPVAWELGLLWGDNYGLHNVAYDDEWKEHSPGRQLLVHNLSSCHASGLTVDFLPGNLGYKRKFSTCESPVHELYWFSRSFRGFLARRLILMNMKARRRIRASASADNRANRGIREAFGEN